MTNETQTPKSLDEQLREIDVSISQLAESRQLETWGYNSGSSSLRRTFMKLINYFDTKAYSTYSRMIVELELEKARLRGVDISDMHFPLITKPVSGWEEHMARRGYQVSDRR